MQISKHKKGKEEPVVSGGDVAASNNKHSSSHGSNQDAKQAGTTQMTSQSNNAIPIPAQTVAVGFFVNSGKQSLMNRVANSPKPITQKLDGRKTMGSTVMGSTMAESNMKTMEVTKSSPFKDTISRGMLTGNGLLSFKV